MLQLISCILDPAVTTNFLTVIMGHPVDVRDQRCELGEERAQQQDQEHHDQARFFHPRPQTRRPDPRPPWVNDLHSQGGIYPNEKQLVKI